jgi:hypothetical protein
VSAPNQLGDGRTHRITNRNKRLYAQRVGERCDVIGAVLEQKPRRGNALTVPALIEYHHPSKPAHHLQGGMPHHQPGAGQPM